MRDGEPDPTLPGATDAPAAASALRAGDRHVGVPCPVCERPLTLGDGVMMCSACGQCHHADCWTGVCGSYECAPIRRDLATSDQAVLLITSDELQRAAPLPPSRRTPAAMNSPSAAYHAHSHPPRTSRLAVAAFICSLAAIPIFGLVTGSVAVLMGALALPGIRHRREKGAPFAVAAIVVGMLAATGWVVGLSLFFAGGSGYNQRLTDFRMTSEELEHFRPEIQRAMRANVLINAGRRALGSGVILYIEQSRAHILTNRHVVDLSYRQQEGQASLAELSRNLEVLLLGHSPQPGRVEWLAPHGIDLAVVSVPVLNELAQSSLWPAANAPRVGDDAFAIGNPHALGWTYTRGTISQFRTLDAGSYPLQYIQTETAINPGSSGGGLYDAAGHLIGINTLTDDKRVSEGLSFAISFEAVRHLLPRPMPSNSEAGSLP